MIYHGYSITFIGFGKSNQDCIIIRERGSDEILTSVESVSEAIECINAWEKHDEPDKN